MAGSQQLGHQRRRTLASLPSRTALRALMAVLALALTAVIAACGEDEKETSAKPVDPQKVTTAYLEGMAGHHESAIEMAKIGQTRGQSSFIKNLSNRIVSDQERELGQMQQIHRRLFDTNLSPDMGAHDELGLTAQAAGMDHDAETNRMLESANPFDRAFVDEMVPHHKGAVRMSRWSSNTPRTRHCATWPRPSSPPRRARCVP